MAASSPTRRRAASENASAPPPAFDAVKVFSATMLRDRQVLGEHVTGWIAERPEIEIGDIVVTQSSDYEFHCISLTIFYWQRRA